MVLENSCNSLYKLWCTLDIDNAGGSFQVKTFAIIVKPFAIILQLLASLGDCTVNVYRRRSDYNAISG
jgi:hypothetical protein